MTRPEAMKKMILGYWCMSLGVSTTSSGLCRAQPGFVLARPGTNLVQHAGNDFFAEDVSFDFSKAHS